MKSARSEVDPSKTKRRRSLGKRLRFEIFKRDGFTCQYCGAQPPNGVLVVDHIIPVAGGGTGDPLNLITACETCNQGKSDRHLPEEKFAELRAIYEAIQARQRQEDEAWRAAKAPARLTLRQQARDEASRLSKESSDKRARWIALKDRSFGVKNCPPELIESVVSILNAANPRWKIVP